MRVMQVTFWMIPSVENDQQLARILKQPIGIQFFSFEEAGALLSVVDIVLLNCVGAGGMRLESFSVNSNFQIPLQDGGSSVTTLRYHRLPADECRQ